jgi:uncharacterized protein YutD
VEIITTNMENYTDKFAKRVKDLVEQSKEPIKTVECIDNDCFDITLGINYEVLSITDTLYLIVDDRGLECLYHLRWFKDIEEPKTVLKRVKFRYAKEISMYSDVDFENTYDVVKITNHYYTIVDDKGKEQCYNKDYFHKSKKAKKKEKKIKLLRNHLAISKSLIDFFKDESISSFAFSTYYNLNKIAFEEINKDNPDMNRMKFLMDSISKINKTTNK